MNSIGQKKEEWESYICNSSAVCALILSQTLNMLYLGGTILSVVVLSPILLLLEQDKHLFQRLGPQNRYAPVILSVSLFWLGCSVVDIYRIGSQGFYLVKELVLLGLTLPGQYCIQQELWNSNKTSLEQWLLVLPLNLIPLFYAQWGARLEGAMGLLVSTYLLLMTYTRSHYNKNLI